MELDGYVFRKDRYDSRVLVSSNAGALELSTHGQRLYSSFSPDDAEHPFRLLCAPTTPGHAMVPGAGRPAVSSGSKEAYSVYLLRDPIRHAEIQISEHRRHRRPGSEGQRAPPPAPGRSDLDSLRPLLSRTRHARWLWAAIAQSIEDREALEYIEQLEKEVGTEEGQVLKVLAANPAAPEAVKKRQCLFCDQNFRSLRAVPHQFSDAIIMANDFPFGPFFHYIVLPSEAIHTWTALTRKHFFDMNWLVHEYLGDKYSIYFGTGGSTGLNMGLNTAPLGGKRILTAHPHRQVWGVAPGSPTLADRLLQLCYTYEERGQDYLGAYLAALEAADMIVWSDDHVVLYVPFGQIASHELQIMLRRPGCSFLELTKEEVQSLSIAESLVVRLYTSLGINMFNELLLSPSVDEMSRTFRLIFTFITRDVELGVSELSQQYVVDRHPYETLEEITRRRSL